MFIICFSKKKERKKERKKEPKIEREREKERVRETDRREKVREGEREREREWERENYKKVKIVYSENVDIFLKGKSPECYLLCLSIPGSSTPPKTSFLVIYLPSYKPSK